MNIIDHGKWVPYTPAEPPKDMPANVLYLQRESDGVDWYDYSRDEAHFQANSIKFQALHQDIYGGYVIGPVVTDVSMLFPRNQVVVEIADYAGASPAELQQKIYDPEIKAIHEPVMMAPPKPSEFDALLKRIEALERRG